MISKADSDSQKQTLFGDITPELQGPNPEERLKKEGYTSIAGIDEAGRGPLAGPVVAAAVILDDDRQYPGVGDSKKLTPAQREDAFWLILENALDVAVGMANQQEIDRINILQASLIAMTRAVEGLSLIPDHLLIDGTMVLPKFKLSGAYAQTALPHGDDLNLSIGAASIVAKVVRDRIMMGYDLLYPDYGFASHKGYGTRQHLSAIEQFGPCQLHRFSFERVKPEREQEPKL